MGLDPGCAGHERLRRGEGEPHRGHAQHVHHQVVVGPAGIAEEYLRPVVRHRRDRAVEAHHRSRGHHDLFGSGVDTVAFPYLGGQRLPEFRDARVGGVAREAVDGGPVGRLHGMGGSGEVGFAHLQVDGVAHRPGQLHDLSNPGTGKRCDGSRRLGHVLSSRSSESLPQGRASGRPARHSLPYPPTKPISHDRLPATGIKRLSSPPESGRPPGDRAPAPREGAQRSGRSPCPDRPGSGYGSGNRTGG